VIVQDDIFSETISVTVCPLTGDPVDMPAFRVPIQPTRDNGLEAVSRVMTDKLSTIPRTKVGKHIGALTLDEMDQVDRAVAVFLGLAG
jgi:mRNA interferase MazF